MSWYVLYSIIYSLNESSSRRPLVWYLYIVNFFPHNLNNKILEYLWMSVLSSFSFPWFIWNLNYVAQKIRQQTNHRCQDFVTQSPHLTSKLTWVYAMCYSTLALSRKPTCDDVFTLNALLSNALIIFQKRY